jgi:hypothetical protein
MCDHISIAVFVKAEVAELADAQDSKSCAPCGHEGSTPSFGTIRINRLQEFNF